MRIVLSAHNSLLRQLVVPTAKSIGGALENQSIINCSRVGQPGADSTVYLQLPLAAYVCSNNSPLIV